jgi:uncharacterized protein YciI
MFLVLLTYIKPVEEVEKWLDDHVTFLDTYYTEKKFVFSGRRNPRVGGVILISAETEEEVQEIIKEDPFFIHQIAEYNIIEFFPTKYDERFSCFVDAKVK